MNDDTDREKAKKLVTEWYTKHYSGGVLLNATEFPSSVGYGTLVVFIAQALSTARAEGQAEGACGVKGQCAKVAEDKSNHDYAGGSTGNAYGTAIYIARAIRALPAVECGHKAENHDLKAALVEARGETYPQPKQGWQCFHCGEWFTTRKSAVSHFGASPDDLRSQLAQAQGEVVDGKAAWESVAAALLKADARIASLEKVVEAAECCQHELAALFPNPRDPTLGEAATVCQNANPADAQCILAAYLVLDTALQALTALEKEKGDG